MAQPRATFYIVLYYSVTHIQVFNHGQCALRPHTLRWSGFCQPQTSIHPGHAGHSRDLNLHADRSSLGLRDDQVVVVLDILDGRVVQPSPRQDAQGQCRCKEVELAIREAKGSPAVSWRLLEGSSREAGGGGCCLLTPCPGMTDFLFQRKSGASPAHNSAARPRAATAPG